MRRISFILCFVLDLWEIVAENSYILRKAKPFSASIHLLIRQISYLPTILSSHFLIHRHLTGFIIFSYYDLYSLLPISENIFWPSPAESKNSKKRSQFMLGYNSALSERYMGNEPDSEKGERDREWERRCKSRRSTAQIGLSGCLNTNVCEKWAWD